MRLLHIDRTPPEPDQAQVILDGLADMLRACDAPRLRILLDVALYTVLLRQFAGGTWHPVFALTSVDGRVLEVRPREVRLADDREREARAVAGSLAHPSHRGPIEGSEESIPC
jgi:hypothetical protein